MKSACPRELNACWDRTKHDMHLAGEQIVERRHSTAIWHMNHIYVGHHLEQFAGQVRTGPVSSGCHVDLAWMSLGVIDEINNGPGWKRWIHNHHVGHADRAGDWSDVAEKIESEFIVERRV